MVNITMTGVDSGIQRNIYVKPPDIPPSPFLVPPPFTGLIWALKDRRKTSVKAVFHKMTK